MSKVIINGNAVVVKSSVKLEDIKKVEKYRGVNALTLYEGEGECKEPVFIVKTGRGIGSIDDFGAVFANETNDKDGYATITITIGSTPDAKECVAELIGAAILKLNKIEEKIPAIIHDIDAEKASIMASISVAE